MGFEEWWDSLYKGMHTKSVAYFAKQAWDQQQERIDELNECLEQALSDLKYWEDKASALEYDKTGV